MDDTDTLKPIPHLVIVLVVLYYFLANETTTMESKNDTKDQVQQALLGIFVSQTIDGY